MSPGFLSNIYSNALRFTNANNQWAGDGKSLTKLNPAGFTGTGTIPDALMPLQTYVTAQKSWGTDGFVTSSTLYVDYPNSTKTFSTPIAGTAVLKWNLSGFTTGAWAVVGVGVFVDGNAKGIEIPFGISNSGVHQYSFGTVSFPITAGTHTV